MNQQHLYDHYLTCSLGCLGQSMDWLKLAVKQLDSEGKNGETLHYLEVLKETYSALSLFLNVPEDQQQI